MDCKCWLIEYGLPGIRSEAGAFELAVRSPLAVTDENDCEWGHIFAIDVPLDGTD